MTNIRTNRAAKRGTDEWDIGMRIIWRGYMHHVYGMGYPQEYDTMPRGWQVNYERGRLLAATLRGRGIVKEVKDYKNVLTFAKMVKDTADLMAILEEERFNTKHLRYKKSA